MVPFLIIFFRVVVSRRRLFLGGRVGGGRKNVLFEGQKRPSKRTRLKTSIDVPGRQRTSVQDIFGRFLFCGDGQAKQPKERARGHRVDGLVQLPWSFQEGSSA